MHHFIHRRIAIDQAAIDTSLISSGSKRINACWEIIGYRQTSLVTQEPIYGPPVTVSGLRLVDARASYGIGLETFALGFPVHIDWSWKTLLNKDWEDQLFAAYGGSTEFRKPKVTFWIGYDF